MRFGATDVGEGPVDFAFDVVGRRSTFELGLSLLAQAGTSTLIGLSPGGETARIDLPRLFAKRARDARLARRRPPAGRGLPAPRGLGARRRRSISPAWSRAWRRSTNGAPGSTRSVAGDVVRTVLTP